MSFMDGPINVGKYLKKILCLQIFQKANYELWLEDLWPNF
jgi:hypothetical protein